MHHQVSVRGKLYDQLKARADKEGVTVGTIVERAIASQLGIEPINRLKRNKPPKKQP